MWCYAHEVETAANPEQIWPFYAEVERWSAWDADLERVELGGPFAAGSEGRMVFRGQPPLPFRLTAVRPQAGFDDETVIPGVATVRFRHDLEPISGGTRIRHAVEVEGPAADQFGPQIAADFPTAMATLARLAERG